MTARHAVPAPTPEIELSPYPRPYPSEPSSSTSPNQPLLRPDGYGLGLTGEENDSDSMSIPARRHGKRTSLRRYWKPLLFISIPFALVFLYSVIHPHVPGLPALPKVKVHLDHGDNEAVEGGGCVCGQTNEGKRLCEVYRPEGLTKSQLVTGSGARVRRIIQKARDGERIKVGILGGSGMSCCLFGFGGKELINSIRLSWFAP
jgi:hypothetical protein